MKTGSKQYVISSMVKIVFSSILLTSCFLLPTTIFAQTGGTDYKLLEPIPYVETTPGNTNVQKYIPGVVKLVVGAAGALAVIMIIIGGIQYMSTDAIGKKDSAKHTISNAIWGFILVLSSWLILVTINPDLVEIDLSLDAPVAGPDISANPTGGTTEEGATTQCLASGQAWNNDTNTLNSDLNIRTNLAKAGIGVNNSDCTYIGKCNCTSLKGLNTKIQNGLKILKQDCPNCNIRVSGGTEYWRHGNGSINLNANITQHRPGGNAVDLSLDNNLSEFFRTRGTPAAPLKSGNGCGNGSQVFTYKGATYVQELSSQMYSGGHWHVCY